MTSSSAFFRLAAANTSTPSSAAWVGPDAPIAITAVSPAVAASIQRRLVPLSVEIICLVLHALYSGQYNASPATRSGLWRAPLSEREERGQMQISARNRLKGRITEVTKGATTAHVKIDVGGTIVTSSI